MKNIPSPESFVPPLTEFEFNSLVLRSLRHFYLSPAAIKGGYSGYDKARYFPSTIDRAIFMAMEDYHRDPTEMKLLETLRIVTVEVIGPERYKEMRAQNSALAAQKNAELDAATVDPKE